MTLVTIDLGDVAGGHASDDHVIIRAEAFRESQGGGVTSTAEVKIPLVDGVGQAEVEPGPVVVSFRCRAVADTREKRGVVPDEGPVGIEKVLENAFEYLPPVVDRALETIKGAVAAEVDAIKWDRGQISQGTNLDELTTAGFYQVRTFVIADSLISAPTGVARNRAALIVYPLPRGEVIQVWRTAAVGTQMTVERVRDTDGVWQQWARTDPWLTSRQLTEGEDVRSLPSGYYTSPSWVVTQTIQNRPDGSRVANEAQIHVLQAGHMKVIYWHSLRDAGRNPGVFVSHQDFNGNWTSWRRLAEMSDIEEARGYKGDFPGTDLSAAPDYGTYWVRSWTIANGLTSPAGPLPFISPGVVEVHKVSSTSQHIIWRPFNERAWQLSCISGVWGKWVPLGAGGGVVSASDYGVRADGNANDTEAFKSLVASAGDRVISLPTNGRIVLHERINMPAGVTLLANGCTIVAGHDMNDYRLHFTAGTTILGQLNVETFPNSDRSRGVSFSGENIHVDSLSIRCPTPGAGAGSIQRMGVLVQGENIKFGTLAVHNHMWAVTVSYAERVTIDQLRITGHCRGLYVRNVKHLKVSGTITQPDPINSSGVSGHNGVLIEASADGLTSDLHFDGVTVADAGASGFRVGSDNQIRRVWFDNCQARGTGTAGFKVLGSHPDLDSRDDEIIFTNCVVEDAGNNEFNSAAILVHKATNVQITSPIIKARTKDFCGGGGIEIQGCEKVRVSDPIITDPIVAGIVIRDILGSVEDVRISGGSITADTGVYIDASHHADSRLADIAITETHFSGLVLNIKGETAALENIRLTGDVKTTPAVSGNVSSVRADLVGPFSETSLADGSKWTSNTGEVLYRILGVWTSSGVSFRGTGSPEGKVTAPVGSTYIDTAAATGALTWAKTTGTGNTGWAVEYGDTGWRNVTELLLTGWSGSLHIARHGAEVTLTGANLRPPSTGVVGIVELPVGFRPSRLTVGTGEEAGVMRPVFAFSYSPFRVEIRTIAAAQSWANFTISFMARDPWPATLPGTPA